MDSNLKDYNTLKNKQVRCKNKIHEDDKILCNHCKRTRNNKLFCLGICVADSDY